MLLADLQPASFRGARFLVPKDSFEDGRNTIEHLYPDSSLHYMEDNGKHPGEFSVTAILHGADLQAKLRRLMRALNTPGPGTLKHPYFGSKLVAVCGPYKGERQDTNSGVITLDIKFKETGPPLLPALVSGVAAFVSGLATSAVTALFSQFVANYGVTSLLLSSRDQIGEVVTRLADGAVASFGSSQAGLRLSSAAASYVDLPEIMGEQLSAMMRAPIDNLDNPSERLSVWYRDLMDLSTVEVDRVVATPATTFTIENRRQALLTVTQWVEVCAYILLCQSIATRTYATASEVERQEADLIARWELIQTRDLPEEITRRVREIVTATSEVLRDQAVRLPNTTTIDVVMSPASVITYMLYDSEARLPVIVDLNPNTNPILLTGPVTVLADA